MYKAENIAAYIAYKQRKGSLIENILIKEYFQNNIRKYS